MTSPTEEAEDEPARQDTAGSWKITAVVCLVVVAVAAGLVGLTFSTEPTAEKGGATKKTAMLVEVVAVERGAFQPRIVATGTVQPARDVELRPQVAGRVVSVADEFVPGGFVSQGALLVRLESADYENQLAQRKSDLRQALAALAQEKGMQGAARADYEFLGEELPDEQRALVLREAQLEAAQERIAAARAAVAQAELDVRRTRVTAPFDAHVLRRDVNLGSQVTSSDVLGRLVGLETYWVTVEVPVEKLRFLAVPRNGEGEGSPVKIRNRKAWPPGAHRDGQLFRLIGAVDGDTRMARVIAEVPDPFATSDVTADESAAGERPPLMVGAFVEVEIEGVEVSDVVRLPRDYLRKDDKVWVMADGKLEVRDIDIAVTDADYVYVRKGLADGDQVVTTNLSTPTQGAPLRLRGDGEGPRS